ncbi:AfsR/SARP family transcriptional regulator [Streptomyces longispororuber]|uniref:AfsR/SARP family transcriptional regulator n=1 Tax=Streptomyces longispororuber TaxID=68230 RepID=UPI00210D5ED7|nr:BTAD domain-containing putative transcriptional regulator [Streptomyces longispororuber]MCQ4211721.1 SARP family transcriptional regulator [Streptomyces longispororuber]
MSTLEAAAPRLRLLGGFTLTYGPAAVDVGTAVQRLLAYLGLRHHSTRTVVAGTLWPDVTEERAHGSLRTALWRLHQGRESLVRSEGDTLELAAAVAVDARALMDSALHVVDTSPQPAVPPHDPIPWLLFAGELLPGWDDEWILFERERLRQLRLHALDALAHRLLREGRHALALEAALESVRIEPLRESAHRAVVAVHLAEHNVVEATRHYRAFRDLLHSELGVEPSVRFVGMFPMGAQARLTGQ